MRCNYCSAELAAPGYVSTDAILQERAERLAEQIGGWYQFGKDDPSELVQQIMAVLREAVRDLTPPTGGG